MAYEFVTYEKKGRIATVTINRPERMNALHPPANLELHEIWNDFQDDPEAVDRHPHRQRRQRHFRRATI